MKLLKKLFNWIWSNVQEVEPELTPEWVSYEVGMETYNKAHNLPEEAI